MLNFKICVFNAVKQRGEITALWDKHHCLKIKEVQTFLKPGNFTRHFGVTWLSQKLETCALDLPQNCGTRNKWCEIALFYRYCDWPPERSLCATLTFVSGIFQSTCNLKIHKTHSYEEQRSKSYRMGSFRSPIQTLIWRQVARAIGPSLNGFVLRISENIFYISPIVPSTIWS